jgi:pimeloyl-ACP methyl ester carboxylesterase
MRGRGLALPRFSQFRKFSVESAITEPPGGQPGRLRPAAMLGSVMRTFGMAAWMAGMAAASVFGGDVTSEGIRVHYESYGRGKEAVVFIHGWTCDLTFWRGQAPFYQKRRSLLIDLPGHGRSGKPDVAYTQERFARAVEAAMRDAGVEKAVLVGHSMGGPVVLTFLRLFPAQAKAVVLVDAFFPATPTDDVERERQKAQGASFAAAWRGPDSRERAEKMVASMFTEQTTPALREEIRAKMLAAPAHVRASAFEGMFLMEPPRAGETFGVPALALMTKSPSRAGYDGRLRALFPNLRNYEAWEGAGHFLMRESPERFNRALEDFLAQCK